MFKVLVIFDFTTQKFKTAFTLIDKSKMVALTRRLTGCVSALGKYRTKAYLDVMMDGAPCIAPWFSMFRESLWHRSQRHHQKYFTLL